MMTLNHVPKSKQVVIKDITNATVNEHLSSMGFTVGSTVTVISKLPFNGAIAFESHQTRVAIRATDAAHIVVMD